MSRRRRAGPSRRGVAAYDHGPQHPLRPDRVLLTWDLIEAYGLRRTANVQVLGAEPAGDELLARVHTEAFIDATDARGPRRGRRLGAGSATARATTRSSPTCTRRRALVCGASVRAAEAVWTGGHDHAFNAAGGLHHAMPARASGFCVYDDPAVAIAWLLDHGAERVAYVDVDVHHGDGPQAIF